MHRIRTIHLFAGAGGGILADILLGHQCIAAVEIDPYCQQVLSARQKDGILPWFPIFDDIREFDGKPWQGLADCIAGGFPCQNISCAGKGAGIEGERSGLWSEMARVVGEVRPRYVFVENSPNIDNLGVGRVYGALAEMDYDCLGGNLSAGNAGFDHERKRKWIFATNTPSIRSQKSRRLQEWGCKKSLKEWQANNPLASGDYYGQYESRVGRDSYGTSSRVDRLKALGNAQVPAVAALAWEVLSE